MIKKCKQYSDLFKIRIILRMPRLDGWGIYKQTLIPLLYFWPACLAQVRRVDKCLSGSLAFILFQRQSLLIVTLNPSSKSIELTWILSNINKFVACMQYYINCSNPWYFPTQYANHAVCDPWEAFNISKLMQLDSVGQLCPQCYPGKSDCILIYNYLPV